MTGAAAKALLFDYDGLIVDSESIVAAQLIALLAEEGISVELADVGHVFGGSGPALYQAWASMLRTLLGEDVDVSAIDVRLGSRTAPLLGTAELRPGVLGLLRRARRSGWLVGLGTGRPREPLLDDLRRVGLAGAFDAIVVADDVEEGKPAPDIFVALALRLGVSPGRCVVLEDSPPGCRAGLRAGMRVVACPSRVTAGCRFPRGLQHVGSLEAVDVDGLSAAFDP